MGDAATATKENQPIIISPSSYAPPPAPAAPSCGCSNCGASAPPTVIKEKSGGKSGASAARKAEKSVKHSIEKLEKKMDDKQAAKDTVAAIEKVKEEQKKSD